MQLSAGTRLKSTTDTTEVVVVKAPSCFIDLRCGGQPTVPLSASAIAADPLQVPNAGGSHVGKRYADEQLGLEVLCTKAGDGSLSVGDRSLPAKAAKPLPSSD